MMNYTVEEKEVFYERGIEEAEIALEHDEIPIGCVIVKDGEIIGRGIMRVRNCSERLCMRKLWP